MKTKKPAHNLEQRISYLGYQKLEEEMLLEKLREKISQPISEDKYGSTTLRQCSFEHIITKLLFIITFVISTTNPGWCQTDEEIISQFERKQWELDNGFELLYYTFTPTAPKPTNGYPLIVGLHGSIEMIENGEGGHLIRREVIKGWITPNVQNTYAPYVLAPQISLDRSWGEEDVQAALDAIIQTLIDEGTVDPNQIYVLGHSIGGFGAWAFPVVSKIPVAAIAPMSGFWFSDEEANPSVKEAKDALAEISVWAFQHATEIDPRSSANTRAIVNELKENDVPFVVNDRPDFNSNRNKHLYTEYTSTTLPCAGVDCHRVCDTAIKNTIFTDWLFLQQRGRNPATAIQITNVDTVSAVNRVSWVIGNTENSVAIYFQPVDNEEWIFIGKAIGRSRDYPLTGFFNEPQLRGKIRVDALNADNEVYASDTSTVVTLKGRSATDQEIVNQFERKQWTLDNGFELPYYTFTPTAPKPANGYPLIVGLHGTGEMADITGLGSHLIRREVVKGWITPEVQDKYAPYVLAPQASEQSWGDEDVNTTLDAIIKTLIDEGTVDPDRIYVLGHSVGGFGAWAFPTFSEIPVAAIAPMAGFWIEQLAGAPLEEAAQEIYPDISVWVFHHQLDFADKTQRIVATLEENGLPFIRNNTPHPNNNILNSRHLYTEYTSQTYDCASIECHRVCDVAIKDPIFIEWLFQQRRGRPPATAIQITAIDTVSSVSSISWAIENQENSVAIYFQPVNSEEWILLGQATGSKENYQFTSLSTVSQLRGKLRVDALNANIEVYGSDTSDLVTLRRKVITDVPSEVPQTTVVVYPNPAKDVLYWQGADRFNEGTYYIVDVLGRVVAKGPVTVDGVSVSQLARGSYLLALHSSQHLGETVRVRFLKQ